MTSEEMLSADRSGNHGVATDVAYPLATDSAHAEAETVISELVAVLAKGSTDLSRALLQLSKKHSLSSSAQACLSSIKSFALAIELEVESVMSSSDARVPQSGGLDRQVGDEANGARSRRPKNRAFDFLLLEALHVRPRLSVPVGLDDLKQIAKEFDHEVKVGSLVAKLNRWKNDDKLLHWVSHEDMHLTAKGISKRNELFDLARKTGRLGDVNEAIFRVLGVRSSY